MTLQSKKTRFRAYQLNNAGSSLSYFNGSKFTLIEARYNESNQDSIKNELSLCGQSSINDLHITSWDLDHCSPSQLEKIITDLKPSKIEYPGYPPHTDAGKESLKIISHYRQKNLIIRNAVSTTPCYIKQLDKAENYGYTDILYHPKYLDDQCHNNNSTIKQFRSGSFNVLSLGDVECNNIAAGLRRQRTIYEETDIMILAHHGADNGFTTSAFIKTVKPTIAISTSNYANQYEHPKQEIRDLLHQQQVKLFTTKNGDVLVYSTGNHNGEYKVINLKAGSTQVSSQYNLISRKTNFLKKNPDTIRAIINKQNRGPRLK